MKYMTAMITVAALSAQSLYALDLSEKGLPDFRPLKIEAAGYVSAPVVKNAAVKMATCLPLGGPYYSCDGQTEAFNPGQCVSLGGPYYSCNGRTMYFPNGGPGKAVKSDRAKPFHTPFDAGNYCNGPDGVTTCSAWGDGGSYCTGTKGATTCSPWSDGIYCNAPDGVTTCSPSGNGGSHCNGPKGVTTCSPWGNGVYCNEPGGVTTCSRS